MERGSPKARCWTYLGKCGGASGCSFEGWSAPVAFRLFVPQGIERECVCTGPLGLLVSSSAPCGGSYGAEIEARIDKKVI
jgi:hypothetical protein